MQELINQAKIDEKKLRRFILTTVSQELSNMNEPCYYPQLKKYKFEILKICNLKENDVKKFVKDFYKGTKWARFNLNTDDYSNLLISLMYYSLINDNEVLFNSLMIYFNVRIYSNIMHKMITYCNPETFKYALESLSSIHLFSREKTIPNAIHHLSKIYSKKYKDSIKNQDIDEIGKFVQESRHRISQSVKSLASKYYELREEGYGYKAPYEGEEGQVETPTRKGQALINNLVQKITVHREYDKKALEDSVKLTKINDKNGKEIVQGLSNSEYEENLNIIFQILITSIDSFDFVCGDDFYKYIRKLMNVRSPKEKVYFKQQILALLEKVLKDINKYTEYRKLNDNEKKKVENFLAYYLAFRLRNFIC